MEFAFVFLFFKERGGGFFYRTFREEDFFVIFWDFFYIFERHFLRILDNIFHFLFFMKFKKIKKVLVTNWTLKINIYRGSKRTSENLIFAFFLSLLKSISLWNGNKAILKYVISLLKQIKFLYSRFDILISPSLYSPILY